MTFVDKLKRNFRSKSTTNKVLTAVLITVVFLMGLILISVPAEDSETQTADRAEESQAVANLSDEERIKKTIKDLYNDPDTVRGVEVQETESGFDVMIDLNAGDNLSVRMIRTGIESDMSEAYIALYTQNDLNIQTITIKSYFPLVDLYGNEGDQVVYQSQMSVTEAQRVNWSANEASLKVSILPEVWDTQLVHPDLRQN